MEYWKPQPGKSKAFVRIVVGVVLVQCLSKIDKKKP